MYTRWRDSRSFRRFVICYGLLDRKLEVTARSSLEAGRIFENTKPGELMHNVKDTLNYV